MVRECSVHSFWSIGLGGSYESCVNDLGLDTNDYYGDGLCEERSKKDVREMLLF